MPKRPPSGDDDPRQSHLPLAPPEPASQPLYQHTALCQACLPYRNPGDDVRVWERRNGGLWLRVEAGAALDHERGEWVQLGLPYGPKPRLILAHLNAEAIRTGSPEIDVQSSLRAFVRRMGLREDGRYTGTVRDQLNHLAGATIRIAVTHGGDPFQVNAQFIERFELWYRRDDRQRVLWPGRVTLSDAYFATLGQHAVPLHPVALGALASSALALDLYAWLAQRLHRIEPGKPQRVSWAALKAQFGWEYDRLRAFRAFFRRSLEAVHAVYVGARFDLDQGGMVLHWSPPPISKRRAWARQTIGPDTH